MRGILRRLTEVLASKLPRREFRSHSGFTRTGDALSGTITYTWEGKSTGIYWEAASGPTYDTGIAPIDLREWDNPKGEKIPLERQIEILHDLRRWLDSQGIRSNIALPAVLEFEDKPCIWAGCRERKLRGYAYCLKHFERNMLRT